MSLNRFLGLRVFFWLWLLLLLLSLRLLIGYWSRGDPVGPGKVIALRAPIHARSAWCAHRGELKGVHHWRAASLARHNIFD